MSGDQPSSPSCGMDANAGSDERDSKTTSHSSLATSSGGGSNAGDLSADFQRQLVVGQQPSGTRDGGVRGASASPPSSGHTSRIMSPAPSNASSVRSPIVGIHSRALVKKLQENGSVCSVHSSAGSTASSGSPGGRLAAGASAAPSASPKKGGLKKRAKVPSGGSTSSGEGGGVSPGATLAKSQGSVEGGGRASSQQSRASVHFAEGVELPSADAATEPGSGTGTPTKTSASAGASSHQHPQAVGNGNGKVNGTSRSTPTRGGRQSYSSQRDRDSRTFDAYMTLDQVQRGLKKGELIEGVLRINPKRYEDAYISAPDEAMDIYICGRREQNRALNGDRVAVQLLPVEEWKVFHDRVLDTLSRLTDEEFRQLYGRKDLSSRPAVAEMVDMARRGNLMNFNLFNVDDADDSAVAGMIGGSFSDPNAVFGVGFWRDGDGDGDGDDLFSSQLPKVKFLDLRHSPAAVVPEVDSDYDFIVEDEDEDEDEDGDGEEEFAAEAAPSPAEAKDAARGRSYDDVGGGGVGVGVYDSDVEARASPNFESASVAVAPDELLGDVTFVARESDSDGESDAEAAALQRVEDEEFFANLDGDVGGGGGGGEETTANSGGVELVELDDGGGVAEDGNIFSVDETNEVALETETAEDVVVVAAAVDVGSETRASACDGTATTAEVAATSNNEGDDCVSCPVVAGSKEEEKEGGARISEGKNLDDEEDDDDGYEDVEDEDEDDDEDVVISSKSGGAGNKEADGGGKKKKKIRRKQGSKGKAKDLQPAVGDLSESDAALGKTEGKNMKKLKNKKKSGKNENVDIPKHHPAGKNSSVAGRKNETSAKDARNSSSNKRRQPGRDPNDRDDGGNAGSGTEAPTPSKPTRNGDGGRGADGAGKSDERSRKWRSRPGNKKRNKSDVKAVKLDCGLEPRDVLQLANWRELVQRKGRVVFLLEKKHPRLAVGFLKPRPEGRDKRQQQQGESDKKDTPTAGAAKQQYVTFHPVDPRTPRIKIPVDLQVEQFLTDPDRCSKAMFLARITKWAELDSALGELVKYVGEVGHVEAETQAILLQNCVDDVEFPDMLLDSLPANVFLDRGARTFRFPNEELQRRKDFSGFCVVSVDPETARDLDDAVSVRTLPDGMVEVGVHIADVAYYVPEGSPLDGVAADRATSVYMVQRVVPMLPRPLCEHLCSLNPGEPKLAFSVVWKMKWDGTVLDYYIGRTVIQSKCKLSYSHAQAMIECEDPAKLNPADFPPIFGGEYDLPYIAARIKELDSLAKVLRKNRFDGGALSLDMPKISFRLNSETGMPESFDVYERRDSNMMIEEFMLLANATVAEFLHMHLPRPLLLRRHPQPNQAQLGHIVRTLKALGHDVDADSAKSIHESLRAARRKDPVAFAVMTFLFAKPMQLAQYFVCTPEESTAAHCKHYALNMNYYTHFTSPIRRYADVCVHRMLAAILRAGPELRADVGTLKDYAQNCNARKEAAKRCSEDSVQLFFNHYLATNGPLVMDAIVTAVNDRSFDVFLPGIGSTGRVYLDKLGMKSCHFSRHHGKNVVELTWAPKEDVGVDVVRQRVEIFSCVRVQLTTTRSSVKFSTNMLPPDGAVAAKAGAQQQQQATDPIAEAMAATTAAAGDVPEDNDEHHEEKEVTEG